MLVATSTDPEAHAKVVNLANKLQLPPELVARNPQWAQHQSDLMLDAEKLTKDYPGTAKFLSDPNRAAVSRDELIQHMALEDTVRNAELLEPGLFGKDVRDAIAKQLREKGHQIEIVDGSRPVSEWFPTLDFTAGQEVDSSTPGEVQAFQGVGGMGITNPAQDTQDEQSQKMDQKAVQLYSTPQGFWERMITGTTNLEPVPFVGAGKELVDVYALTQLANRVKDGTADDNDWIELLKYDNEIRRGTDFGGKVAAVLVNLPAFAGEIAATGGLYTAGSQAARKAGLYAAKKILNKSAREVAESAVLRGVVKTAGWVAGSAVQATVGMPHRVAVDAMQRMVPQLSSMSVNEQGELEKLVLDSEDGFASAIGKAILNQSIEVGTESAGAFIGKVTGLEALKSAVVTKWFKLNPTKGWSQFSALLRKAKWDGVLEEFGEERLGEILRAVTGLESMKLDPEQYAVELVSFAALPMAGAAVYGPGMVRQSRQLAERAQTQVEFFRDLGAQSSESKTRTRVPGMLGALGDLAAQDGPVERVFAPIAAWDQYFASKGIDPRQVAQETLGETESYDKAREAGHDLEIPIGAYTEKLAPTEHNEALAQVLRLGSVDAPNVVEMQAGLQATQASVEEMLKLNQDYTALSTEKQTLATEITTLQEQVSALQAQAEQRTARMQEIQSQLQTQAPQALQEILAGNAPAAAELQGLAQEYQALAQQDQQAQQAGARIEAITARQKEIDKEIARIEKRNAEARRSAPGQAPEVVDMAGEVYTQLMATKNTSDSVARAHANMFARMAYIMANRSGMSLQQFKDRFVTQILGSTKNATAPAGVTMSQEEQQRDADYLAAVEAGDMETAQRLVNEAAKAAGYITKAYHGGHFNPSTFTTFTRELQDPQNDLGAGFYFSSNKQDAARYDYNQEYGTPSVLNAALRMSNPYVIGESPKIGDEQGEDFRAAVEAAGYDGIVDGRVTTRFLDEGYAPAEGTVHYVVFNPNQIKSVEPVTRDADGNVIPLSERFDEGQNSILYQGENTTGTDIAPAFENLPSYKPSKAKATVAEVNGVATLEISKDSQKDKPVPKAAWESGNEVALGRLDKALKLLDKDPERIASGKGFVEYLNAAGVWGVVTPPPSMMHVLLNKPEMYVDLLNGGYHGTRTEKGTQEAARAGLDGTVEMRNLLAGEAPHPWAVALHHLWGILSRMLAPLDQEAMRLRLITHKPVLDAIQSSIDGTFTLTPEQWEARVKQARIETEATSQKRGNSATANANAFYAHLANWNGNWDKVADIYASKNAAEMGRRFWKLNLGKVGIRNKVQRFIGLTFGVPGVILDRWKFVELWLPTMMQKAGITRPSEYFAYSGGLTPEDPLGVYGVLGGLENDNNGLSLALYEGLEKVMQKAIDASPLLQQHMGQHQNPGGMHWFGWNAIKNESVGHSSLDLTKQIIQIQKQGSSVNAETIQQLIASGTFYTEGLAGAKSITRFAIENGVPVVTTRSRDADGQLRGLSGSAGGRADGQGGSGETTAQQEVTLNQSVFPETQRTPLLAIHNISGANILNAAELGGLPVPSIGVTRPDAVYTGFGEISLIGTKDLADPRRNPVFNADAYTVRFPQPEYGKMKQAAANKIIKPLLPFQKLFNDYTPGEVWQRLVERGDVASAIDKLSRSEAAKAAFLDSKGITVEPVMYEPAMNYGWSNSDTLKEYLTPERMKQAMAGDENIRRELVPVVEAAIRKDVQKKNLDPEDAEHLVNRFKKNALSTDGGVGFNILHRIETDWSRADKKQVDLGSTRDVLNEALKGREAEFEQWVQGMILAEAGEPKLTIGRKKVPFTLENIVDYMTSSSVKGVESTMTFGEGKARAMSAAKIADIEEMRNRAQSEIGTKEEVDAAREKASKLLSQYREKAAEHYGYADTWSAFDDSMKALAKWAKGARTTANLQKALKAVGFKSVPQDVLELGVEAGKAFLNAPVPYFESKPQRSVALSEFKAAVVPSDTRQEVRQVLADAGVQVFDYTPYDDASRRAAVAQASQETQTLFQRAFHGSPHKFEKFMLDHIGTGEGAQVYGWGLYFAGNREVADWYRTILSGRESKLLIDGVEFKSSMFSTMSDVDRLIADAFTGQGKGLRTKEGMVRELKSRAKGAFKEWKGRFKEAIAKAQSDAVSIPVPSGQLYEVEIPENDVLLDWDKVVPEETIKKVAEKSVEMGLIADVDEAVEMLTDEFDRNGEALYRGLSEQLGGDRAASLFLNSIGIKGIRYLDQGSRTDGQGTHNFVIFDDAAVEMLNTFYQNENNARGSISFNPAQRGAPRRDFTIRMLSKANASTFMHEAAHFYLEVFNDLASAPDAPQALREDWNRISKWLGLQAGVPITVDQHETFARGFERYLMEGKAPAEEVRGFFASMRTWLVRIYRDLMNLNVDISDDIRGVFDRMVATDVEIEAAQAREKVEPMFGTKPDGMEEAAWERYRKAVESASLQARERLQTELQREMLKAKSDERKAEIARVTQTVRSELAATREHIALAILRSGKMPDDEPIPEPLMPMKLDRDSLLSAGFDKDTMDALRKLGVYRVEDGVSVDVAAEVLGFGSADELVQALVSTPSFDKAVKEETKRRVDASHPSIMEDSQEIKRAASDAVRNDKRDEVIAVEVEELQRLIRADKQAAGRVADLAPAPLGAIARRILRSGPEQANAARILLDNSKVTVDFIKAMATKVAQEQLQGMKLRDIRPSLYLAAARAAGARASRLAAAGDFQGALGQKESELLNHILYRESRDMQKVAQKQQRYLLRMTEDAARERLGKANPSYREQVDGILERFNFVPIPLSQVDRRTRLAEWISAQEAKGLTVDIDETVRDEAFRKDFREMTAIELTAVWEAVKQIDHLAKTTTRLLTLQDEREFRAVVQELVAQITSNTKAKPRGFGSKTSGEKIAEGWDSFFAAHRKLASLVREMDGFVDAGPVYNAIMAPINDAGDNEAVETEKATEAIQKLFKVFEKDELKRMTRKQVVRGATKNFNLSREDVLSIALNWGNEDNRQKLVDGYNGLTEQDVIAILDTMTEKEWKFVQSVWDYIDSFWPRIRDKQERVYGIPPEKIEPTPVVTKFGVFKGGYYPLKYAGARAEGESDADAAKMMMRGAVTSSTTRRGHTKERVAGVERPVRLDLGVLTEHVTQVVHDLTHHEMLVDVNRILRNRSVMEAIEEHYGEPVYRQLRKALEAIAVGNTNSEDRFTRALGHIRTGASVAGLGFNLMTSMLQAFGLTNAIPRVGAVNMAKAVGRWIGSSKDMEDSIAWIYERSDMMRLRGKTMNRELNEIRNTVDPKFQTALMDSYFYLIQKGQMLADVPTWLGAYHKAMDAKSTEEEAIRIADQTVIDTQGGGMVKDLANVQRGGPLLKMWTTFYSYFNALWNLNVETVKRTNFKSPTDMGRMMVDLLILNSLPVAIQYALVTALRGGAGGDDEEWYKALAKQQMSYLLAQMVFVRELGGIMDGRNYEGPAGGRFFAESYKLAKQVEQGELDRGFWASANKVGGILFHYPAVQAQRTIEGMKSLWEGKTSNPAVLIVGPSKDQR